MKSTIIIDYDPFSRSRIFTYIGEEEISNVISTPSELHELAKHILSRANWVKINYEVDEVKVCVRAAEVFYDELSRIVQTQINNYNNLPIKMERINNELST